MKPKYTTDPIQVHIGNGNATPISQDIVVSLQNVVWEDGTMISAIMNIN